MYRSMAVQNTKRYMGRPPVRLFSINPQKCQATTVSLKTKKQVQNLQIFELYEIV